MQLLYLSADNSQEWQHLSFTGLWSTLIIGAAILIATSWVWIEEHEGRMRGIPFVPKCSYGRPMREYDTATILYVIVIIFRLEKISDATWLPTVDLRNKTASHDSGMSAQLHLTELLLPCFTLRLYYTHVQEKNTLFTTNTPAESYNEEFQKMFKLLSTFSTARSTPRRH